MKRLQAFSLIVCMASTALGQAEVHLANGAVMKGNVTEDDGEKVKVALIAEGGTGATAIYKYEQLAPQTIYRLRFNKTARDDVKGQLELAAYALDNGVFPSARLSYDLAKKSNEAKKAGMDQEIEKLYARAPTAVLAFAKTQISDKKYLAAERSLARLCELFPDHEEAVAGAKLLEEIAPHTGSSRDEAVEKRTGGSTKTARDAAAPAKKQFDKAHEMRRKALAETKNSTQATRQLEEVITEFQFAQKKLDEAMRKEGAGSDLAAHYDAWTAKVNEDIIETYLDIANLYFSRQSNTNALKAVNEALLLDKENSEALATRARIQIAMSDSDRWRW